jgi:hypothetical protein
MKSAEMEGWIVMVYGREKRVTSKERGAVRGGGGGGGRLEEGVLIRVVA